MKYATAQGAHHMALSRAYADSRKKKPAVIRYQRMKKNGEWGAIRIEPLRFYDTPEEAIEAWNAYNKDTKFRLV